MSCTLIKIDSQDLEGDSQMGDASSSSSNSEDALFPSSNLDDDPMAAKVAQTLSSPPSSQQQLVQHDNDVEIVEADNGRFGTNIEDTYVPGASWNNKKASEDWHRAWAMVEDKTFSLSLYLPFHLVFGHG